MNQHQTSATQGTRSQRDLLEMASCYLPGGTIGNLMPPASTTFVAREGKGAYLWDADGHRYIDWLMGSGPMILGHAAPAVVAAVNEAAQRGSSFFATAVEAIELAAVLVAAFPCAEKVRFTTSGTDACFQCLRVARAFRKRDKVMKFEGGYHGMSDYALMSVAATKTPEFPRPEPCCAGIPRPIENTVLIAPFNDATAATQLIEKHQDELAGVIVEPLQRLLTPQPGFLENLREVTQRCGVPLIFDEVVTGFRLAYGGAQEYYGVVPDLCAVGKIMGGGFPLAAVVGRSEILSVYDQDTSAPEDYVQHVGTLNANPVACAAGLATLSELRKPGTYDRLHAVGRRLRLGLEEACAAAELDVQSSGEDVIFDLFVTDRPVHTYRDQLRCDMEIIDLLNRGLLKRQVLKGWPQKYYPSLAHTDDDVDETVAAFAAALSTLKR